MADAECDACRFLGEHRELLRQVVGGDEVYVIVLETMCAEHSRVFWAPGEPAEQRATTFLADLRPTP